MPTFSELYGDGSNRCEVAISNSYDSCGTITRADVAYATPEGLSSIFQDDSGKWRDMRSLLSTQLELKACGTKTFGLHDWLMSSARSVGSLVNQKRIKGSDTILEPFILAQQKSVINDDYWAISNGWDGNDAGYGGPLGSTPGTSSQRIVRIVSRNGLEGDKGWFPPGATVHIFSKSSGGSAERGQWKVDSVAIATDGTYADVLLDSQNSASSTPHDSKPGQTVDSYFHAGVLIIGANNVSDFESWCNNRPALNPNRNIPFWYQTSRYTLCVDSLYKEWLAYLLERNPLFAKFGDVPLSERNRQLGSMFQKEWLNSFFFGKPLDNQTLAGWTNLNSVNSFSSNLFNTGTEGKVMEYKANAVGVYEQLRRCGQVYDLQGQQLNLRELFEKVYDLVRSRQSQGKNASQVDVYTDTKTAAQIQRAMIKYYDSESNGLYRFHNDITKSYEIPKLGLKVKSYELVYPQGVTLNVITDFFFDDFISSAQTEKDKTGTDLVSTSRFLMFLDLGGGIYPGVITSNRKVHTVGQLEDLARIDSDFACVMKNPTREVTLNSLTWTAIVECPTDNMIVENFSSAEPDAGAKSGDEDDLYS